MSTFLLPCSHSNPASHYFLAWIVGKFVNQLLYVTCLSTLVGDWCWWAKYISNVFGNDDWCRWSFSCLLDCCYVFWTCCSSSQVQMFFWKLFMFVTNVFITCSLPLMRNDICYSNYVHHEWTLDSRLKLNIMILADNCINHCIESWIVCLDSLGRLIFLW